MPSDAKIKPSGYMASLVTIKMSPVVQADGLQAH